jgi:hypothetical protein
MTYSELAALQTLRLERMRERLDAAHTALHEIHMSLIENCIGGPLNDNNLQFNPKQLEFLSKLEDRCLGFVEEGE